MESRIQNTKRNIFASYFLMIIQMLFSFVSRTVIVYTLGDKYLGLSSLFTSIISVLNIAELGFSTSIVYFMYKPLANNDVKKVCDLLGYLRKIYRIIGLFIISTGLILTPFIKNFISGDIPANINIYILYILYVLNTSFSYLFFAYKSSLLTALQRLDIVKIVNSIVIFLQYIFQLVSLLVFKNYYLFVISMIIGTIFVNLVSSFTCTKLYPQYKCTNNLESHEKTVVISKVKGLLVCRLSAVTLSSFDSIIISSFIGLTSVAIYNNYLLIYNAVTSIISIISQGMEASVGNSVAVETVDKNYNDLKLFQFLFSIISMWCFVCLICLYQPFMKLWMGNNMLLPFVDVVEISIWFLICTSSQAFFLYLGSNGLWDKLKGAYIFSTLFNLIMNVILGKMIGTTGIILASLLSSFISGTIWQCSIIFKYYFKMSAKFYIYKQFYYFLITFLIATLSYAFCEFITFEGIVGFVIRIIIMCTFTPFVMYLVFKNNRYYNEGKSLLFRTLGLNK